MRAKTVVRRRLVPVAALVGASLVPQLAATPAFAARSLCAPPADTVPPQVSNVTVSPSTVDLDSGSRRVTVTVTATDTSAAGAASGVRRVTVTARSGRRGFTYARLALSSGTSADGDWVGRLSVPRNGPAGTWKIDNVDLSDASGNYQSYPGYGRSPQTPDDVRLHAGWQTTFTVTGTGPSKPPPKRIRPGRLVDFRMSPTSVDSRKGQKTVHVAATFRRPAPKRAYVLFDSTSRRFFLKRVVLLKPTSATRLAGRMVVSRWVGNGRLTAQLDGFYGGGARPQYRRWDSSTLSKRHFSDVVTVTSRVDRTKPTLTSLAFTPAQVDTTTGTQTVTVTATGSDTLSGLREIRVDLSIRGGTGGSASGFYPYPHLGYRDSSSAQTTLKREGQQWVGQLKFRECVPGGNWSVDAFVTDNAFNYRSYGTHRLGQLGLPNHLAVTSTPGDVESPSVRDATASGVEHAITLDFTEGVKNVDTSTVVVYALSPKSSRYQNAETVTGMACSNGTAYVDCSGSGGLVTSVVLTVPSLTAGSDYEVYANPDAVTPQLSDGNGNPLQWGYPTAAVTGS